MMEIIEVKQSKNAKEESLTTILHFEDDSKFETEHKIKNMSGEDDLTQYSVCLEAAIDEYDDEQARNSDKDAGEQ